MSDKTSSPVKMVRRPHALRVLALAAGASLAVTAPGFAQTLRFHVPTEPMLGIDSAALLNLSTGSTSGQVWSSVGANEGTSNPSGGGLEATLTWTGGGAPSNLFSNAANWGGTAPLANDILNLPTTGSNYTVSNDLAVTPARVNVDSTGAGVVTYGAPAASTVGNFVVNSGSAVIAGGSHTFNSTQRGNDVVGAINDGGAWALTVGRSVGTPANLTINGGAVINATNAFLADAPGSVSTLTVDGAGTKLITPNRVGFNAAGGTMNITNNGEVQGRLYEFGRQTVTGPQNITININTGGKLLPAPGTLTAGTAPQLVFPRNPDYNATMNLASGGQYLGTIAFTAGSTTGAQNTVNFNVTDAGTVFRNNGSFIPNGGGGAAGSGTTNINVANGGKFSVGLMNGTQNGTRTGATSAINVVVDGTGSVFEAFNGTGFQNSYLIFGTGAAVDDNSHNDTITIRNGGLMQTIDTDGNTLTPTPPTGNGQAFLVFNDGAKTKATVNVETGGDIQVGGATSAINLIEINSGATSTFTMNISSVDGSGNVLPNPSIVSAQQLVVNTGERTVGAAPTVATINVGKGGQFNITGADTASTTFVNEDKTTTMNINVAGGSADLGGAVFMSGGNQDAGVGNFGAGTTNVAVTAGGTVSLGRAFLMQDAGVLDASEGGVTSISVSGAGSTFIADGVDNTTTTGIDSGYLAISSQLVNAGGTVVSPDTSGRYGQVTLSASAGGLIKTTEASLLDGIQDGTITVNVTGAGSVYDSGRQFSLNSDLEESADPIAIPGPVNSTAVVNITGGGVLKTTGSLAQAVGSMFIGTDGTSSGANGVGTTSTTITVSGAGSTLQSSSSIFLGASVDTAGVVTTGTPVTLNAGPGTTIASSSTGLVLVGATSSVTTAGTVSVGDVAVASGSWTVNGGSFTSASLELLGAAQMNVTPTNALAPLVIRTGNLGIGDGATTTANLELHKNAIHMTPGGTTPTTVAEVKQLITDGIVPGGVGGISSADLNANTFLGYRLVTTTGVTFLGSPAAVGDILVRYTLIGDATLDGTVNFDDLLQLAANYNGTSKFWYEGDFTHDGNVNFDDLLQLAAKYNQTVSGSLEGDWALAQSAVPEPTSLLAIGLGGAALLGRRRR